MQKTFFLTLACLITIFFDQISKYEVMKLLANIKQIEIIPGFFNLVTVWNKGISFGVFNNYDTNQLLLLITSALVIIILLYVFVIKGQPVLIEIIALGMIIGGALGNMLDRIMHGAVFDFLFFYWRQYYYPAFNIADSAICIGAAFLAIATVCKEKNGAKL